MDRWKKQLRNTTKNTILVRVKSAYNQKMEWMDNAINAW